jgi:hypothetical protein
MRYGRQLAWALLVYFAAPLDSLAADLSVSQIAAGIRDQHYRFLHLEGGVALKFKLHVEQMKSQEVFLFGDGAEGLISIKWPDIYVSIRGTAATNGKRIEREGQYNFETQLGAGRDGLFAQFTPYRHQSSASLLLPLICSYFEECDQKFVPDQPYRSSRWLPSCLESQAYKVAGSDQIGDLHCIALASSDDMDMMWVDPDHGFALAKREIRDRKTGLIKEKVVNSEFRQIANELWFPGKQLSEYYDYKFRHTKQTRQFTYRYTVTNEISAGNARKIDISLPDQATVHDELRGITYVKARNLDRAFAAPLKQAAVDLATASSSEEIPFPWSSAALAASTAVLLSASTTMLRRMSSNN